MTSTDRARQAAGQPTGGQFAATAGTDAGLELSEQDQEALAERARYEDLSAAGCAVMKKIDALPFVTSGFCDYDERLSNNAEWADAVLAGDFDGINEIDDAYADSIVDGLDQTLDEVISDAQREHDEGDEESDDIALALTDLDRDRLRERMFERDDFNPVADLTRNSLPMLLRHHISSPAMFSSLPAEACYGRLVAQARHDGDTSLHDQRVQVLTQALDEAGFDVDSDEGKEAIQDLVTEGPYDWHESVSLDLMWTSAPGDVDLTSTGGQDRPVKIATPSVLLIDSTNGSGYDVRMPVKGDGVRRTLTTDAPAFTDENATGYGWNAIAGVVTSGYTSQVDDDE